MKKSKSVSRAIELSETTRPHEGLVNGIPFDTDVVSILGVCVELFPTRGLHSVSEVAKAKRIMRNERDVVCFLVTWR